LTSTDTAEPKPSRDDLLGTTALPAGTQTPSPAVIASPPRTRRGELPRFLTRAEVLDLVGLSYVYVSSLMRSGDFPRSRVVGGRQVGNTLIGGRSVWLEEEVCRWILSRPTRQLRGDAPGSSQKYRDFLPPAVRPRLHAHAKARLRRRHNHGE